MSGFFGGSSGGGATPSTGGAASVTTAGQGYLVSGNLPYVSTLAANPPTGANGVRATQFVLPFKISITKVTITIVGIAASEKVAVGIYDAPGTTKLLDSGTFDGGTASTQTLTIGAVTLNPGVYWFAQTTTNATVTVQAVTTTATQAAILNNNVVRMGNAANASVAGVLPAALGVVSAASFVQTFALFEP